MLWHRQTWFTGKAVPTAIFAIGVCISAAAALWIESNNDAQAQAEFGRYAERVAIEISRRFRQPIYGLNGVRGVYAANPRVNRAQFEAYVESRDLPNEFPGVRGFGFIQPVKRTDVKRFVAAEQADGAPEFAIRQFENTSLDDLYVVKYISPFAPNAAASGLDIWTEQRRRDAAQHAIDTGESTLTPAIALPQNNGKTPGMLLYLPVYRTGTDPTTVQQRRAALIGLLYAPIVIAELLDGMPDVVGGRVNFQVFDTNDVNATATPIYDAFVARSSNKRTADSGLINRFSTRRILPLPGRDLTLNVSSTAQLYASFESALPRVVFAGGALASIMLALLFWQAASGRRRAEVLARRMTTDLDRLAAVARGTSNAVVITNIARRIIWVNEGFERVSGYSAAEALGRSPGELLQFEGTDPATVVRMRDSFDAGATFKGVILNRGKSGQQYWLELEIQPLRSADGTLTGFMAIETDITDRRQAQAKLEAAMRETDALLSTLNMHAIISVANGDGNIIDVNEAFCLISGYNRDELLGQNHRIVNSGVQSPVFWQRMWQTIAAGTPWRGIVCDRARDDTLYWVDMFIAPFLGGDGKIEKYISISTDVTANKQVERELVRERARLGNIIDGTDVGTWEWNVDTGQTEFNERWAQIAGYTLAELGTVTVDRWNQLIHSDDLSRSAAALEKHFDGATATYQCDIRILHKAGHWVWVLACGKLFSRASDGRPCWMAGTYLDISERKHAQQALRASEAFLDQTGRIAGVGGWEVDLTTNAVHWSDQTCRIHDVEPGYQPTIEEGIRYYAPEAQPLITNAIQHCIETGEGFDLELPFITAKGRAIWVHTVGEAEVVDGKPLRLIGAFQDITARREMEMVIRRQNELMTSVMENLPCGLSVFDSDLQLVAANAEFRRLLELPDALFMGPITRFEDIIRFTAERGEYGNDDIEGAVQHIVARARASAKAHRLECVRPDGRALEIRGGPMPRGGFINTYTDISSRRAAEAEVQRSAQLLRGAIETIDEAFVLFDPEDRLVLCNDKYREIFAATADLIVPGVSFEELVRKSAERGHRPAAEGRIDEWIAERMAQHRAGNSTLVQQMADGRSLRVIERKMPDGHTVGFRIDITEMVRATEAAQAATAAAEAATMAKSQFLANTSHEIRTPMNAILGMLALLRKTDLSPRQADYASKSEGAARSLLGLLNDILDFSKADAGKMTLDPEPFRIDKLLRELSVILSANIGAKPVEVLFDIDPNLPRCLVGDAMRLQQVLINLSSNAIKFTSEGEVVVSIVVLAHEANAVTLEIAVRDTGIGIAPENQARIFSGFTQAEASTTRRFGGTGLGVAISHRLVALMGGELKLDSALGEGSRFHFAVTLPVIAEPAGDQPARATFRALVVDDNPTAREVLERMCHSLGWTVDVADCGERALEILRAQNAAGTSFDAVFVDWQMPGLDGWETSRRIHDSGRNGETPIIVMVTAHGREKLAGYSEADQAMLDGFLVKPVTASMLLDAVVDARSGSAQPHLSNRGAPASGKRLLGLRLLVAEDNLNNQQIARELLEDEGAMVQIANNGQEAVDAVTNAEPMFDIVLMDLQMPVLDGFGATRRIRELYTLQALPIIAMTANAMAADREACLAAGMNDHVGKPFDLNHLVGVLQKHAGREQTPDRAADVDTPALPAGIIDVATSAGVEIEAALERIGGSLDLYQRMLRSFMKDLTTMPARLSDWVAQGDMEAAQRQLHTLKGVAATLSITALTAAASRFETQLATQTTPADANMIVQQAGAAIAAAGPGLTALIDALDALDALAAAEAPRHAPTGQLDASAFLAALRKMTGQLESADMAATDAMTALQREFGQAPGVQLQPMDEAINALDFQRALQLCDELISKLIEGQSA